MIEGRGRVPEMVRRPWKGPRDANRRNSGISCPCPCPCPFAPLPLPLPLPHPRPFAPLPLPFRAPAPAPDRAPARAPGPFSIAPQHHHHSGFGKAINTGFVLSIVDKLGGTFQGPKDFNPKDCMCPHCRPARVVEDARKEIVKEAANAARAAADENAKTK